MTEILKSMRVVPYYGQIVVQDSGTADVPGWETGEEPAVASGHCVLVATQGDLAGPVTIRVVTNPAGIPHATCVFDGEILMDSGVLEFGSIVGGHLERLQTGTKRGQLRVFVEPLDAPHTVTIALSKPSG